MAEAFAFKVRGARIGATLGLLLLGQAVALATDWPQYRGPATDGSSPDLIATAWATNSPGFVVWTNMSLTNGFSSFAVSQGRAFTLISKRDGSASLLEYCVAVDAATGANLWATPIDNAPWDPSYNNGAGGAGTAPYNTGDGPRTTPSANAGRVFALSGLAVVAQPHIFNTGFCFGFPIVTANKRGDIGITLAAGGKAGGAGTAAQGYVGIDDEFTSGIGVFGTVTLTASGTHNRSDNRYGDYFTIHSYEPCEKWFSATNYARLNGTAIGNINSRYIEFGRNQSFRCYQAHRNQLPSIQ